jgi:hypothetical protein
VSLQRGCCETLHSTASQSWRLASRRSFLRMGRASALACTPSCPASAVRCFPSLCRLWLPRCSAVLLSALGTLQRCDSPHAPDDSADRTCVVMGNRAHPRTGRLCPLPVLFFFLPPSATSFHALQVTARCSWSARAREGGQMALCAPPPPPSSSPAPRRSDDGRRWTRHVGAFLLRRRTPSRRTERHDREGGTVHSRRRGPKRCVVGGR